MKIVLKFTLITFVVLLLSCSKNAVEGIETDENSNIVLSNNWKIKRANEVKFSGEELTTADATNNGWINAKVPTTVMDVLVKNGVYKNPYFKDNIAKISMDSILKPWWFVTSFELPEGSNDKHFVLNFDGINYKADVYLNGKLITDTTKMYGAFNTFSFPVSDHVKEGKNLLAVKLYPPSAGAYTIGFVDWAPVPPDKNMGIWRAVRLSVSDPVEIKNTFVHSKLNIKNFKEADLMLRTQLVNHSDDEQNVTLKGTIEQEDFSYDVKLKAKETKTVQLSSKEITSFKIINPRVWWPVGYGKPEMYSLNLLAEVDGNVSSKEKVDFGIREVSDYLNKDGHRGYKVNGQEILIKGAGWVDALFLENTHEFDENQVKYVVDMNMNCIRFEGFWGKDKNIYSLCDKYGLLAMVGFSCQWEWADYIGTPCGDQFGCAEEKEEIELLAGYWDNQIKYLRNHPSIFVWVGGSDFLPHPELEKKYLATLKSIDPSRPYLAAAKLHTSIISGSSGVKMEGPYDYVTPNYWYTDSMRGGAFGFNTETGPGPQPPVLWTLKKMYGDSLNYPIDTTWNYHHGRHAFGDMSKYLKAFNSRYGSSSTLEDFAYVSQIASYEAIRPMFESFRVNRPNTTGIVQWMLNSAWPETFWQLYDSYLHPTGAYYGTKKANAPVQAIYNYGNHSVYIDNCGLLSKKNISLSIELYDFQSQQIFTKDTILNLSVSNALKVLELPTMSGANELLFLTVKQNGKVLATNNYWLSKKQDVVDPNYENSSWVYTPNLSYADFTGLRKLEKVIITQSLKQTKDGFEVTIQNTSAKIAFGVELSAFDAVTKEPVLPVIWSDNYLVLKPNEKQIIKLSFPSKNNKEISVVLNAMNLQTNPTK